MGIRISKDIGYFIPQKNFSKIFIGGFREILDEIDHSEKETEFFKKLLEEISADDDLLGEYRTKQYEEYYNDKNRFMLYNLVSQIYFFDTFKGVLFKTVDLDRVSRHDDTIDYYESDVQMKCSIKYLYRPIYPVSGYNYNGGLGLGIDFDEKMKEKIDTVQKKLNRKFFSGSEVSALYRIVKNVVDKKDKNILKEMVQSHIFTPCVDQEIYLIAKNLGIIKEGVSRQEFEIYCEPAIITSWG